MLKILRMLAIMIFSVTLENVNLNVSQDLHVQKMIFVLQIMNIIVMVLTVIINIKLPLRLSVMKVFVK